MAAAANRWFKPHAASGERSAAEGCTKRNEVK